jgi:hypothetical protein
VLSINESSRLPMTWKLFDGFAQLATPITLRYRIDCESTGRELTGWTDVDAASTTSIVIPATVNVIQVRSNSFELKTVTVEANSGTDNAYNDAFTYRVKNQLGVT